MECSLKSGTMWLCNHEKQEVYSTSVGSARIVLGVLGRGFLKIHSDAVAMGYM